ncbi:MAG TPA: winged helix-turn-helix domain-containing protein, partial [Steroidobacteraceae bacterium]|nr:winged helix-turn-helix domain-containing protein [Steroidobacteraceae bacterium]
MDTPANSPVRFGVFELDATTGELRRSGHRVALQPQPLEILRALIERPGEVVTREELRRRLWSNGAYVDFDRGLNKAIVKLRHALSDDADSPRYIETLPRHGYRFIPLPRVHAQVDAAPPAQGALTAGMPQPEGPASAELSPVSAETRHGWRWAALGLVLLALPAWLIGSWFRAAALSHSGPPANVAPAGAMAFAPPPHSIAVLPFVNISGDKEQEYLSDGLTEELLNSLSRIDGLQVVGRTSSFYFKGKDVDLGTVGRRLNVAAVLEGSVRRSAHTVRVTARLTSTVVGFQLWSETYDRDLGDILRLQSEIANAAATALKVKLTGDTALKVELGGTRNPAAFDAYLRASRIFWSASRKNNVEEAVAGYTEAIAHDPDYALAHSARSIALLTIWSWDRSASDNTLEAAMAEALRAVELAPELADSHLALGLVAAMSLDFARAQREFEQAMALAPGSERILRDYSGFATAMGHIDSGIAHARRAVQLSPLDPQNYGWLAQGLEEARRYDEAIAVLNEAIVLALASDPFMHARLGITYYKLGNFERAREECEIRRELPDAQMCLAITYEKLGRHRDARVELAKLRASAGDTGAYLYAAIHTQWGRPAEALEWLNLAMRLRAPDLIVLKIDPLMDPLRKEPRFQAIERELK